MSPFAVFMVALAIVVPIITVLCNYIFRGSFLRTIANIVIALAAAFVVIGYVTAMYGIKVYLIGVAVIAPVAIFGFMHIQRTIQGAIKKSLQAWVWSQRAIYQSRWKTNCYRNAMKSGF